VAAKADNGMVTIITTAMTAIEERRTFILKFNFNI
jgi:hypothetical protein